MNVNTEHDINEHNMKHEQKVDYGPSPIEDGLQSMQKQQATNSHYKSIFYLSTRQHKAKTAKSHILLQ